MPSQTLTIFLPAPADTRAAGAAFAQALLEAGRSSAAITLAGPLGAGKTTFAQGFGEALGLAPGEVASPTFALADLHRGGRFPLNHLDLYRLGGDGPPEEAVREFLEAGLDECLDEGFSLVEWPERLPEDYWPPARYRILIRMAPPQGAATVGPGGSAPGAGPPGAGASPGRVLELQGELPAERLGELLRARGLEAAPGARAPSPRPGPHP